MRWEEMRAGLVHVCMWVMYDYVRVCHYSSRSADLVVDQMSARLVACGEGRRGSGPGMWPAITSWHDVFLPGLAPSEIDGYREWGVMLEKRFFLSMDMRCEEGDVLNGGGGRTWPGVWAESGSGAGMCRACLSRRQRALSTPDTDARWAKNCGFWLRLGRSSRTGGRPRATGGQRRGSRPACGEHMCQLESKKRSTLTPRILSTVADSSAPNSAGLRPRKPRIAFKINNRGTVKR
ncbi:hypothetical protein K505DRAFT_108644 [Melanomma pulvis-pyrius CBS 109.77]|uniref:Uncharacterized protein n=1 Tax=Melanomma pulvis-pyrius CBS 109.77 TaxID=1314802 RepID=A0A6A6XS15_9PLEO|nr:hypothetical protein K505DRAFT_108644 [Melanomma pulvis-pyrius CBS 109.77]